MRPAVRLALLVLVVALGVRIAAAAATGLGGPPQGDERGYALLAESLARGARLALPLPGDVVASVANAADTVETRVVPLRSFRTPGLPVVLAPIAALGGGLVAMRAACLLLGALGAPLLFLALRQAAGVRAALLASLAYAAWPPAVFVSLRALSEPLCLALLLGSVLALRRRTAVSGLLAGLAILTRPAALLPAVLLTPGAGSRRRAGVFLATLALVLAPWLIRTTVLHGRPLLSTNSGATLVGGNSEVSAAAQPPGKWVAPSVVYAGQPDAPDLGIWGWSMLGEAGSDARFTADALAWVSAHPIPAVRLAGAKLLRLIDPDPRSTRPDAAAKRWIGWISLPPVLLLGLLGLVRVRRRVREFFPFVALAVGTCVTVVVFYGDARMRATADPSLLAAAGVGLDALLPAWRSARASSPNGRSETPAAGSG